MPWSAGNILGIPWSAGIRWYLRRAPALRVGYLPWRNALGTGPLPLLCGPFPQKSLSGSRYILTFIDDYSRRSWVYFLALKSETLDSFKHWRRMVEQETNTKLSCLRTDRGGEYLSSEFTTYCKLAGIKRQLMATGTPQQNGLAERKNRHLYETMRSLLFGANLPAYLWGEAA
jgi:transposase InsO family protein